MRARTAETEGFVEHDGTKIHYEVYGQDGPTILLLPTWTIIHTRFWKAQIPFLARHFRVVTYDGPGNGSSDRPDVPGPYGQAAQVAYARAVLAATGTGRAVVVGLSRAANWALELAVEHADLVHGTIVIAPSMDLARPTHGHTDPPPEPDLTPSRVPELGTDPDEQWVKYSRRYWQHDYLDFAWFFFGMCFSEPHSTKQIEDAVGWAAETTPEVLIAESQASRPDRETLEGWCARLTSPLMVVHGDGDRVVPMATGERLAELAGGRLEVLAGAGHVPLARDPVRMNLLIAEFADRFRGAGRSAAPAGGPVRNVWSRSPVRPRRVLYLSSPIGLGHARRDLAIARELRELRPGVEIDWLTQHPVTRMLTEAGERVHPASHLLVNESAHFEGESGEHDLHCFQALREMDEILVANFMVFHEVVGSGQYDLVVGDESWEVDHFLHENPDLKRFAYAWLTDFVGYLPMPGGGRREELVAADYNAEMIEHIARSPRLRDRAIFVGDPEDVVDQRFGSDLPLIREWTREHYDFAGYVTGTPPALDTAGGPGGAREALRARLGYRPGEQVCVVTVGGSGIGGDLLAKVLAAYPAMAARVPGLRLVVVTGPRIDPAALRASLPGSSPVSPPAGPGVEIHGYLTDLDAHLAASDLAVVQGGLTTCMELTAAGRPFLYVPLRHHFEQNVHVPHRLDRHGAGRRLDYADLTPEHLATAVAAELGRTVDYLPVPTDGANRAARMLAELF